MSEKRERVDVSVIIKWDTEGKLLPQSIFWKDGAEFVVDKILDIRKAASLRAGGMGYAKQGEMQRRAKNHMYSDG